MVISVSIFDIPDLTLGPQAQAGHSTTVQPPQPISGTAYEFQAKYVNSTSNGDFSWYGNLISIYCNETTDSDDDCFYGIFSLMRIGTRVFGEIVVNEDIYHIKDLTGDLAAIVKQDNDTFRSQDCGMNTTSSSHGSLARPAPNTEIAETISTDNNNINRMNEHCFVDVLVCYTEQALEDHPDVEDVIELGIDETNRSLRNSGLELGDLNLNLVGIVALSNEEFQEGDDWRIDAASLPGNGDIAYYRGLHDADIVVIMVPDVYSEVSGAVTEIGLDETYDDRAFALVEIPKANSGDYAFAHEVAHLFGARHNGTDVCDHVGADDDPNPAYAHGFAFSKGCNCWLFGSKKWFSTIMSICDTGKERYIEHFSNPDEKFKNKETGIDGTNNNARRLKEEACRVADYVTPPPVPSLYILGRTTVCAEETYTYVADNENIPSPFTYAWRLSSDGFNWGNPLSTTSLLQLTVPNDAGATYHIQLTITDVDGNNYTTVKYIFIDDEVTCALFNPETTERTQSSGKFDELILFPNPANNTLYLDFSLPTLETITIQIFDVFGNNVHQFKTSSKPHDIDISNLVSGCYWINIQSKGYYQSKSFIVTH